LLAVVMFTAFFALLFLQVRYMRTSMNIRTQQFDEQVNRSLYNVMRDLEQDQTLYYLEQDMIESENRYTQQYSQSGNTEGITNEQSVTAGEQADVGGQELESNRPQLSLRPEEDQERVFITPRQNASTISKTQYEMQQILSKRYLHERSLLDEVIFKIMNRASNEPIENRVDFNRLEQNIRLELSYNGLNEPFSFQVVDKPILKLTNKDYNDNGLSELITLYGSAYNVNIKIFNDLQHTITGWPGGKPDADDTYRPERANPYPKRVIIFSPHPDDDVISMGGTFQRLVNQGHEVHVAYQTSGNIAVGDEEVIRYTSVLRSMLKKFDPDNTKMLQKYDDIRKFLLKDKKKDDMDTADILFIKGRIRREEARSADRYVGLSEENVHFLDLPFYETGTVKKNPISEKDVNIVKDFIETIKPHQIYVAGDLADPHGTHKVCLDAILAAIDILKDEDWYKDCRIWMYRGAWMEWEIDHIEMAVPLSPEELRQKRNSILQHQSQMEGAPFLGDDERLFWQRSEDRNRATADLYWKLGLASYEAIEAFVEYIPIQDN
jgi:LmbE family N-acetylglucosaminyl deacetylase